jgi:hypothetical protein
MYQQQKNKRKIAARRHMGEKPTLRILAADGLAFQAAAAAAAAASLTD